MLELVDCYKQPITKIGYNWIKLSPKLDLSVTNTSIHTCREGKVYFMNLWKASKDVEDICYQTLNVALRKDGLIFSIS